MAGMTQPETEAFAAGIEGLREAYPMLTPEMLSETVRAVLGKAGPLIRAGERERCIALAEQHGARYWPPGGDLRFGEPFADVLRAQQ